MAGEHGRAGRAMALPLFPGSLYHYFTPSALLLLHRFIFLLTNLLPLRCTSASSARNTVQPNAWERDHYLVYPSVYVRMYVRERNLNKEEAHGGPGTCNPRTSGTCNAKREGATRAHPEKRKMKAKKIFRASRGVISATRLYALPPAAFNI